MIVVTPEMIEAGVAALEDGLLEEASLPSLRPQLVSEIFNAMLLAKPHSKMKVGKPKMKDSSSKRFPYLENIAPVVTRIAALARAGARFAASEGSGKWGSLALLDFGEGQEAFEVFAMPARVQVPLELARVDFDADDSLISVLRGPLRAEIEPFIEGVGNVRLEDSLKGFVVLRQTDHASRYNQKFFERAPTVAPTGRIEYPSGTGGD